MKRCVWPAALLALLLVTAAWPAGAFATSQVSSPGRLIVEPQAGATPYLRVINGARHVIDLNSYLLSDYSVQDALVAAAKRGVKVRVIVAGDPYGASGAVTQEQAAFAHTQVVLRTAPPRFEGSYTFDHAKYLIVDAGYPDAVTILGSSNMTYSGLGGGNREYDWATTNRTVVAALAQVFNADWTGKRAGPTPRKVLVLSPGAQQALVALISSAHLTIDIETEEFGYVPAVVAALQAKLREHVSVRIVVPSSLSSYDLRQVGALARAGAHVVEVSRPYIHAKLVIADGRAFIGSENFSNSSLKSNREVGIILSGIAVSQLAQQFNKDFVSGHVVR